MQMILAADALIENEAVIEENLKQFLLVLAISLSVATLPQVISWFRQIPYTLLLVIVGLCLAFVDVRLANLSPGLILSIFLPPLLFEAAWNLKWTNLKKDFVPIGLFAVFGVLISIVGVAFGLNQFAGLSLTTALLVGAILSATDPVSVVALFRELGASKRLTTIMEGESLFNDGMAVVSFSFLVALPFGLKVLTFQNVIIELVTVVGIGIGIGSLVGFGISYLTQRFDLPLVEQSLTLVSAYGTYILTEELGGSGVIAVVTTGMILGNFGSRIGMNPRTRLIVTEFWDFLAFFVNSIVFLLIGDQIRFAILGENLGTIGITIAAMLLARAVSVYGLGAFSNLITKNENVAWQDQTVLWWGGVRGSVSIALALSVPAALGERQEIIATVFGVVLFTLLVQGLTIKPLLNTLGLLGAENQQQDYLTATARRAALNRVLQHLRASDQRPEVDAEFYRYQVALVEGQIEKIDSEIANFQKTYPNLKEFSLEQLREELLAIEADTYAELVKAGRLSRELAPFMPQLLVEMD